MHTDITLAKKNNDEIDAEIDYLSQMKHLSNKTEREIMSKVAFTDLLLSRMKQMSDSLNMITPSNNEDIDNMTSTDQPTQYPVKTLKFDEDIAYHILEKPTPNQATQGQNENNIPVTAHQSFESLDESVLHYIAKKKTIQ